MKHLFIPNEGGRFASKKSISQYNTWFGLRTKNGNGSGRLFCDDGQSSSAKSERLSLKPPPVKKKRERMNIITINTVKFEIINQKFFTNKIAQKFHQNKLSKQQTSRKEKLAKTKEFIDTYQCLMLIIINTLINDSFANEFTFPPLLEFDRPPVLF